jgi:hypothetical protein
VLEYSRVHRKRSSLTCKSAPGRVTARIFVGEYGVVGAEPTEVYADLLREDLAPMSPVSQKESPAVS